MSSRPQRRNILIAATILVAAAVTGCHTGWWGFGCAQPVGSPLGAVNAPVWQAQEANAESADFIVHVFEFNVDSEFLNWAGEDHLKQIAARVAAGQSGLVAVERSQYSARPETEYKYPVHLNPDLDMRRRDVVVRSLMAMGISWADQVVVVAPDWAPEYRAGEAAATYAGGGWGGGAGGWGAGGGVGAGIGGGGGGGFGFGADARAGASYGGDAAGGASPSGSAGSYRR